jgi:hypothetical protein
VHEPIRANLLDGSSVAQVAFAAFDVLVPDGQELKRSRGPIGASA